MASIDRIVEQMTGVSISLVPKFNAKLPLTFMIKLRRFPRGTKSFPGGAAYQLGNSGSREIIVVKQRLYS